MAVLLLGSSNVCRPPPELLAAARFKGSLRPPATSIEELRSSSAPFLRLVQEAKGQRLFCFWLGGNIFHASILPI